MLPYGADADDDDECGLYTGVSVWVGGGKYEAELVSNAVCAADGGKALEDNAVCAVFVFDGAGFGADDGAGDIVARGT